MSEAFRTDHVSPPRRRPGLIALAVLLAFAGGLGIAWWGMTRWAPRFIAPAPAVMASPRPVAAPASVPAPLTQATPGPVGDPAALSAREDLLAARLAAIEARTATVTADAGAASGQAGRAEALLLAAAARRAIDGGLGLGSLEAPLRDRFGTAQPHATGLVLQAAHAPMTADMLRARFEALAPDLAVGGGDWWAGLRQSLRTLIVIHREGEASPLPADRLAQVRRLVDGGQWAAAAAEVSRLPGAPAAGTWIGDAHRYAEVHRALDALEAAAILGLARPAPATLAAQPIQ